MQRPMRRVLLDLLPRDVGADALPQPRKERFLVYLMGPYRTFDVDAYLPDDVDVDPPTWATWDDSGGLSEDDVRELLMDARDCLRSRGYNAFLAIDVGISMERMDPATQSIEFSRASNAVVFVVPPVGANLGVGIEIGSVLEDLFPGDQSISEPQNDGSSDRRERLLVLKGPTVSSAMLRSVNARWDAAIDSFEDPTDLCSACVRFCRHVEGLERRGDIPQLV